MKKSYLICKIIETENGLRISRDQLNVVGDNYTGYFDKKEDAETWIMINGSNLTVDSKLTILEVYPI